ncbi:MAG: PIN domain-containing protein [Deltaproteobacteria bacterium]|nr:PIN domain-containing protein [Deltaproteobacteria bacterium]
MSEALVLDTGGWLEALAGTKAPLAAFEAATTLYLPALVLAEVDYHLRHNRRAMHRVLDDIERGAYVLESVSVGDLKRAAEIDRKFSSLKLGLVDASVIAAAERLHVLRVLTIDRGFFAVRVGPKWSRGLEVVGAER